MIKKATVLGAGSWGTALVRLLANNGVDTILWSFDSNEVDLLNKNREHIEKLKGVKIPDSVIVTSDLKKAVEYSEFIVLVVPSNTVRENITNLSNYINENTIIVCCSKGIEATTGMLLSEIISEQLPNNKVAVLSGPSHAEEVANDIPTTVVSASEDIEVARLVQDVFMSETFRVYTGSDVKGVEIGGALKNIIALCAGISDGLGFGDNTKAALMTRGLAEMSRLGVAMGANKETFSGLSGLGDLIVTCTSMHSRNRRCGILIGQGKTLDEATKEIKMVVEGVVATKSAYEVASKLNIPMPISEAAYQILFNNKNPREIVSELMLRDKKDE